MGSSDRPGTWGWHSPRGQRHGAPGGPDTWQYLPKKTSSSSNGGGGGPVSGPPIRLPTIPPLSAFTYDSNKLFADNAASFYGLVIPVSMGRRAITAVPVWASPLYFDSSGNHFADFAVSIGYSMVAQQDLKSMQVLRVWANDQLVYDAESGSGWNIGANIKFTLYQGREDQFADPLIVSYLGATEDIAFRGEIYIVFQNFPLSKFALQVIPTIRVEVRDSFSNVVQVTSFTNFDPTYHPPLSILMQTVVDWPRNRLIYLDRFTTPYTLHTYDITNMVEICQVPVATGSAITYGGIMVDSQYGYVMLTTQGASNTVPLACIDPMTGNYSVFGSGSAALVNTSTSFTFPKSWNSMRIDGVTTQQAMVCEVSLFGTTLGVLGIGSDTTLSHIWHYEDTANTEHDAAADLLATRYIAVCPGDKISDVEAATAILATQSDLVRLVIKRSGSGPGWKARLDHIWYPPVGSIINWIYVEEVSDDIIVIIRDPNTNLCYFTRLVLMPEIKGLATPTVSGNLFVAEKYWGGPIPPTPSAQPTTFAGSDAGLQYSQVSPVATFGYIAPGTNTLYVLNLGDGSVNTFGVSDWTLNGSLVTGGGFTDITSVMSPTTFWNPAGAYLLGFGTVSGTYAFGPARLQPFVPPSDQIALSFILKEMLQYAGFAAQDIDIDPTLTDPFMGALVQHDDLDVWDMLGQMAKAFRFEVFESEGKVKIMRVGRGTQLTIGATLSTTGTDLLSIQDDNEGLGGDDQSGVAPATGGMAQSAYAAFETMRDFNLDAPNAVDLYYLDYTSEYTVNVAHAHKTGFPVRTTVNDNVERLDVPIIMSPIQAAQYAAGALYEVNAGTIVNSFRLSTTWLRTEPGDVLALTINSMDYLLKVTEATLNADWSTSVTAQGFTNIESIPISGEVNLTRVQEIPGPSISQGWIVDTPPLVAPDCSAITDTNLRLYAEVTSYGQNGWLGGRILEDTSANGTFETEWMRNTITGGYTGIAQVALSGAPGCTTDFVSQLPVVFIQFPGALTVTSGYLLVGRAGRWEYMSFSSATVSTGSERTYTFSGLVRGLRGTEWHTRDHQIGDTVLFYPDPSRLKMLTFNNNMSDTTVYTKAVGTNLDQSTAPAYAFTFAQNFEKPWAPNSLKATTISGGSSGITLSWLRRTRLDFDPPWGTGASAQPLETGWTEKYEIDILSGPSGTVLRTVTGVSGTSYTYTSGNVTTDFGSRPSTLSFAVYQISPVVGRGFPGSVTVDVTSVT